MQQLLKQVARRQGLILLGTRFSKFLVWVAGLYLVALLVSRFLGVIPPWFSFETLILVPGLALILALMFSRATGPDAAARLVDSHLGTKDLFLTASEIDHSLGQYQEVVLAQANEQAAKVKAGAVVKFQWQRSTLFALGTLASLALGVWLLPQLDPFGKQKEREKFTQEQQRLNDTVKATKLRAELLQKKTSDEHAEQIKAAVEDLKKTFKAADPSDKAGTWTKLNEEQKTLGQMWKQLNEEKLKDALAKAASNQGFGMSDPAKMQELKSDLQKNDATSALKELSALHDLADKLANTSDAVEREKMRQELANRLQDLRETVAQQLGSQPMDAAMQRAMEQLQMAKQQGMNKDAMKALAESLNLSQQELQQIQKAQKDMQAVEDALKTLQMAKKAHGMKPLDGKQCEGKGDLTEYAAMFEKTCNGGAPGNKPGEGQQGDQAMEGGQGLGPGQGTGNRPHGDDTADSKFDKQNTPSQLQAGKMLMEWKTHELGEKGEVKQDFLKAVADIRQQASEAVLQEQIPPGYHPTIKNYFNTLSDDLSKPAKP